jgi:hypothetical protein
MRYWVQYYNHQRPHQGLDGPCPADRLFEIQQELRKVIEAGIKENAQALNRAPQVMPIASDFEPVVEDYHGQIAGMVRVVSVHGGIVNANGAAQLRHDQLLLCPRPPIERCFWKPPGNGCFGSGT